MAPTPDFTGYATRSGVKCTDGRVILAHAFKEMDGLQVPLVYQHQHKVPENVLGHVIMHAVDDGIRVEGFFNDTPNGVNAKKQVIHKDLKALSIHANKLVQKGLEVVHGVILEVSLVLAGANPGAFIDNVNLAHGDGVNPFDDEAIIYNGFNIEIPELVHAATPPTMPASMQTSPATNNTPDDDNDADDLPEDASVEDVINSMTDQQKTVFYAAMGAAMAQTADDTIDNKKDDAPVTRNVFDQTDADKKKPGATLSHSDVEEIFKSAHKSGSLKDAVEQYALSHAINDISTLFPYDQAVSTTPEWISRRMEWVQGVLSSTRKTPFSRIRSWTADITQDEARAKGYVKGNLKKEEFFAIAKRITLPQTVYKKQKLDRDDIIDITDFDVVAWLQTELRLMLDEEIARAILVGDGREVDDPDKINATNVRPIFGDEQMYVTTLEVDLSDASSNADEIVDATVTGMRYYRGSGNPVMYSTLPYISKMLLAKDTLGRRLYPTKVELAAALGVSAIVACEALEQTAGLIGIVVNLQDYTIGADKGGQVSMFDFFDIDFNQFKYLMECRMSGAMTKYKGALVVREFSGLGGLLSYPTAPTFVSSTGVVTIPTTTHVTYVVVDDSDGTEGSSLSAGAQSAITAGSTVHIRAKAASTYSFVDDANENWFFTRPLS
jgi:HK97 family phage prohead protease